MWASVEEAGDGFDAVGLVGGAAEDEFGGGVGEADVVELDFVEAGLGGLGGDGDVVGPDLGLEGISPGEAFAVFEEFAVREVDGVFRFGGGERRVLEGDDASDDVDALRVRAVHEIRERVDGRDVARADFLGERDGAGVDELAVVALDVDDQGVRAAATDDVVCGVANDGRGDAVLGEIERVHGEGVQLDRVMVALDVRGGDGDGAVAGGSGHDGLRAGGQGVRAVGRAEHFAVDGDRRVERGLVRRAVQDVHGQRGGRSRSAR